MPTEPNGGLAPQMSFGYLNKYEQAVSVLGPKEEFNGLMVYSDILTAQVIEMLNQRKIRLYAWGEITYNDVFGFQHSTQYCYGLLFGGLSFEPCGGLNTLS